MPSPLDACNPSLNATVSASAGSGKTWLLITRIVRLLIDGAEPGNIIALTFTRKAAAEMQVRLNQRLLEMATVDDEKLENLMHMIGCKNNANNRSVARRLYEKLLTSPYPIRIQTFHSFCQDILSRFPLEADIPPGFDLIEDTSLLELQAWQILFDSAGDPTNKSAKQYISDLDDIMQACNGPDNTRTALTNFLHHRSDWWAYTSHTRKPVDFAINELKQSLELDDSTSLHESDLYADIFNEPITSKLLIFASLLRVIGGITNIKHADTIEVVLKATNKDATAFHTIKSAFLTQKGEPLLRGRKYSVTMEKKLGTEDTDQFLQIHSETSDRLLEIEELRKRLATFHINKAWYRVGQHYVDIFQRLKREQRLLDFNDLEWKCFQLLQPTDNANWGNAHWVQYKIDQRIDHLLIDEFQDTNPTQWQLLLPILEEIAANPEQRKRTVFLVGDEKQSIYSFRRANPALQAQASNWLAERLQAQATPLDFSRRSSKAIIHCVNKIFNQDKVKSIMTGFSLHDTHLSKLPGKVLLCNLFEQENDEENSQAVEPIVFRNPLKQPRQVSVKTPRHDEAEYIARQIKRLIESKSIISRDSTLSHVEYGDILILMRNRNHIPVYEKTLKLYGIPFIGNKKGGLLDSLEIRDLICLLNTLITPFNNLALAQLLKSPIFNASDDDLAMLARYRGKTAHWYECLLSLTGYTDDIKTESHNKPEVSNALHRAASLLQHWQQLADKLPVHDCLDRIFSEGNIINRYIAANKDENRDKVAANCRRFLTLSLETDSGRYPSITRFLQNLSHQRYESENPPEEPLTTCEQSRVRLMTIHGSKGLEAPVVFLADCNSTPRNNNAYSCMVRWPADRKRPVNFQLQLSKANTDLITQNMQQDKLKEQRREELNLLYVALTRAREQLYISGVQSRGKNKDSWYEIISEGLDELESELTGVDSIMAKVYHHLSYENIDEKVTRPVEVKETPTFSGGTNTPVHHIDTRIFEPMKKLPESVFLLAPSTTESKIQFTDNNRHQTHKQNSARADLSLDTNVITHSSQLYGTVVHRILELLCTYCDYPANDDDVGMIHKRVQTEILHHNPAFISQLDTCMQEAISTYNHSNLVTVFNPDPSSDTYNELPVMYMQGQQAIYGIIDRVIKSDNSIVIIDYKSHRLEESQSPETIAITFTVQLDYYREAVRRLWPQHAVTAGILFTHSKQIQWV